MATYTDPVGGTKATEVDEMEAEATDPAAHSAMLFGHLSGVIVDENTDKPVEFATVGIYNKADSSLVTGSITDKNGKFKIGKVSQGDYYVDIRFIGYSNARIDEISIREGNSNVNLGSIELKQSTENIDEVAIVSEQAAVEYKIDKKVILL